MSRTRTVSFRNETAMQRPRFASRRGLPARRSQRGLKVAHQSTRGAKTPLKSHSTAWAITAFRHPSRANHRSFYENRNCKVNKIRCGKNALLTDRLTPVKGVGQRRAYTLRQASRRALAGAASLCRSHSLLRHEMPRYTTLVIGRSFAEGVAAAG
jgi:hypothetical protein